MGNHFDDWFTDPSLIKKVAMPSPDPHDVAGARGVVAVSLAGVLWGNDRSRRAVPASNGRIECHRDRLLAVADRGGGDGGDQRADHSQPAGRPPAPPPRHDRSRDRSGLYQACYFLAVVWVGVAVATMVSLGVAPVVITVWESLRRRRRPPARRLGAVIMAAGRTGAHPRPAVNRPAGHTQDGAWWLR